MSFLEMPHKLMKPFVLNEGCFIFPVSNILFNF